MPKVSVIIPCYNQGIYLDEAVNSVLSQTFQDYEIIIVNDGSTDQYTNELLNAYNRPKTYVIKTKNMGLSEARNNGIEKAQGKYILPLDADDRIADNYLEESVKLLDDDDNIGIVYGEAEFFGEMIGKWNLPEFNLSTILNGNIIYCSAFFRKSDWEKVGGYNKNMRYAWEDWDFWLSILELGREVKKINNNMFYYRRKKDSMITGLTFEKGLLLKCQTYVNHWNFIIKNKDIIYSNIVDNGFSFQSLDKENQIKRKEEQFRNILNEKDKVIEILNSELVKVYSSTSWRFTRPLRWIKLMLNNLMM